VGTLYYIGRSEDEDTDKDSITYNLIDVENECSIQTPIAVLIIFMECKILEFLLRNIMVDSLICYHFTA
jgi:hypothetical protein